MPIRLVLFSIGVIFVSIFSYLPSLQYLWALPVILLSSFHFRRYYGIAALCCGFGWGIYSGHQLITMQLDESFIGKDLQVVGVIADLPEKSDQRLRFNMNIRRVMTSRGQELDIRHFPEKIQLSWYPGYSRKNAQPLPELTVGQTWQMGVRLKRPRGFVNPAGFDYQAWLLRQGSGATGYVLNSKANLLLTNDSMTISWREWVDRQRQILQQWILARNNSDERGILIALLIGDSAHVEKEQWNRMQKTGTSHLIAISGLHVGFLALFGFYVGLGLGKCIQLLWRSCPAYWVAWVMAILCASFYSALAGFNIPTVRTLIMLSVFYIACLWQRSIRIADIFCFALALVVIIDPLAGYDMGFWLSFGAVALLLFYFSGRLVAKAGDGPWQGFSLYDFCLGFIRSQWVMFIGLLIPLSVLVSSVSMVAPIANAIAIPLITFFVVPLLLIGAALRDVIPVVSDFLLLAAATAMEWLKIILQTILDAVGDFASPVLTFPPATALLIAISCLVLLLPKGFIHKSVGWCGLVLGIWLGYFLPAANIPDLKISVLDVGQGTAIVVQVKEKTLVYDTGPKYTDSFDAGGAIVAPYLFSQAITSVDALVISHNDLDHSGGLSGFLEKIDTNSIMVGDIERTKIEKIKKDKSYPVTNCHEQQPWLWHDVSFEFLPLRITPRTSNNNKSCVLLITYKDQTILLPGDIETRAEHQLLGEGKIPEDLTLLLAAHHGSRTSSVVRFVNHSRPQYVIYSAGFRSQHGHPHPQVRERFQRINSREFNTAESGAIIFKWYEHNEPVVDEYRKLRRRYWFD